MSAPRYGDARRFDPFSTHVGGNAPSRTSPRHYLRPGMPAPHVAPARCHLCRGDVPADHLAPHLHGCPAVDLTVRAADLADHLGRVAGWPVSRRAWVLVEVATVEHDRQHARVAIGGRLVLPDADGWAVSYPTTPVLDAVRTVVIVEVRHPEGPRGR